MEMGLSVCLGNYDHVNRFYDLLFQKEKVVLKTRITRIFTEKK